MLKTVSEQKYPVDLLLLLFFISLLFPNYSKIDKISLSCVEKGLSLSACIALEWLVHMHTTSHVNRLPHRRTILWS